MLQQFSRQTISPYFRMHGPVPFARFSPRNSSERLVSKISRPSPSSPRVTSRGKTSPNGQTPFQQQSGFRGFQFGKSTSETNGKNQTWRLITKPIIFVLSTGTLTFIACSIWNYEAIRRAKLQMKTLMEAFRFQGQQQQSRLRERWNRLRPGQKLVAVCIALNTAVFALLWLSPLRVAHLFLCSPETVGMSRLSLLLSNFSHMEPMHLLINMYVLWSFGSLVGSCLGPQQATFLYVSGGLMSSLGSHLWKVSRGHTIPSIGASGAIFALFGYLALSFPDTPVQIALIGDIFPHSFTIQNGLYAAMLLDACGLFLGWKLFDHAGHLAGAIFGLWYAKYGQQLIWERREPIVRHWHRLRSRLSKRLDR